MLRTPAGAAACAAALTAAAYAAALRVGFIGDDYLILHNLETYGGLSSPGAYFTIDFFGFYRPLVFLSHALDWTIWGLQPWGFHFTNLLLHAINVVLVYAVARRALGGSAALVAALLFGLHAAHHEAVYWISGRFDLMATCLTLVALLCSMRPGMLALAAAAAAFAAALLSKESALAFPAIAAAWWSLGERRSARDVAIGLVPLLLVMAGYSLLRSQFAGLEMAGGASRLPKLAGLVVLLASLVAIAKIGWPAVATVLIPIRRSVALAAGSAIAMLAIVASTPAGDFVRQKLAFAGFAAFYLVSPLVVFTAPPLFLDPETSAYWTGGLAATLLVAVVLLRLWRPLVTDPVAIFLLIVIAAALLPVSTMTEGKRYLYLPSIGLAMLAAHALSRSEGVRHRVLAAALALFAAGSAVQVAIKARDWIWAGEMTREAVALVQASLGPECPRAMVVLLTAPVGVRGVYSHFYRETFIVGTRCAPESVRTLVRVVRLDETVSAAWEDESSIVLHAPDYSGNFVASRDLRHFDVPLRRERTGVVETPLGQLRAEASGAGQVLRLRLSSTVDRSRTRFFYFSGGRLHRLPAPVRPDASRVTMNPLRPVPPQ
jgi:hypothetical protein